MDDAKTIYASPQIVRAREVYLELSQLASIISLEISAGRLSALKDNYEDFRYLMTELFYLVRLQKDYQDSESLKKVDRWRKAKIVYTMEAYTDAVRLFDEFSQSLSKKGIL